MTPEEAIEELKQIPSHIGNDCDGYELRALTTAIQALEKQVPMKPREDGRFYPPYACPMCGRPQFEPRGLDNKLHAKVTWCVGCGQAISWEEIK